MNVIGMLICVAVLTGCATAPLGVRYVQIRQLGSGNLLTQISLPPSPSSCDEIHRELQRENTFGSAAMTCSTESLSMSLPVVAIYRFAGVLSDVYFSDMDNCLLMQSQPQKPDVEKVTDCALKP